MKVLLSLINRIDALKFRERLMILLAVLAGAGFVLETYYLDPARKDLARERNRVVAQQERLGGLQVREAELRVRLAADLDAENKERIQQLRTGIAQEEALLREELTNLVSPTEMTRVLRDLVPAEGRLSLVGVRSLPSTPVLIGSGGEDAPQLYRRGVELSMRGEYLALVTYLRAVEDSPWRLHWDVLKLATEEYPRVEILLRVYTLSIEPGWIGV